MELNYPFLKSNTDYCPKYTCKLYDKKFGLYDLNPLPIRSCRNHLLLDFNKYRKVNKNLETLKIQIFFHPSSSIGRRIKILKRKIHKAESLLKIEKTIFYQTNHANSFVLECQKDWFISPQMLSLYTGLIKRGGYKEEINYLKRNRKKCFANSIYKNYIGIKQYYHVDKKRHNNFYERNEKKCKK